MAVAAMQVADVAAGSTTEPPVEEVPSEGAVPDVAAPPAEEATDPYAAADGEIVQGIVVTARPRSPVDPMVSINVESFEAVQAVDDAVVGPLADGYEGAVPDPIRSGLRNFLRNLEEPVIFLNFLLQLKPVSALKTAGRFVINSTVGIGGLVDVAKLPPVNLPYRQNSFGNTFACYGIGSGPYLFLPLIGPTTLRDVIGVTLDKAFLPAVIGAPFDDPLYTIPAFTIDSLSDRVEIDATLERIREEEDDPYAATRELYLKQRAMEIAETCGKGDVEIDPDLPPRAGKGRD